MNDLFVKLTLEDVARNRPLLIANSYIKLSTLTVEPKHWMRILKVT